MKVKNEFVNYLLVYLLLFLSGSFLFMQASNRYLVFGFFVACIAWFFYSSRRISYTFLLYVIFFFILSASLSWYTGGGITLSSGVAAIIKFMVAYLILKTVGGRFSEAFIKVVVFLAVISLLGYLTDRYYLFDSLVTRFPNVGGLGYEGVFYLFRFPWHIDRNNSIFFEPGAYQAFLNAALFLLFFSKTKFDKHTKWIFIGILTTTLVTADSTTGYLIFLAMFPFVLYQSDVFSFNNKIVIVALSSVVVIAFSATFYSTLVVKVGQYISADEYELGSSALERGSDRYADIQIFKKHIFGVGYDQYQKEFASLGRRRTLGGGSTNGVTKTLAVMGLPYSLFLFGSYYWALNRLLRNFLLSTVAFCMCMLFFAGESYYTAQPITFAIIAAAFIFNRETIEDESVAGYESK